MWAESICVNKTLNLYKQSVKKQLVAVELLYYMRSRQPVDLSLSQSIAL